MSRGSEVRFSRVRLSLSTKPVAGLFARAKEVSRFCGDPHSCSSRASGCAEGSKHTGHRPPLYHIPRRRLREARDRRFSQGRTGIILKLGKAWQLPSSVSAGIRKGATAEAKIVQVDGSLD